MKLTKKSGAKIAMTAAALVLTSAVVSTALADPIPGRCFGLNGCGGKGACKSSSNDCKGKNACKGQGWLHMWQDECENNGGKYESI
jgi:hypothetical protein